MTGDELRQQISDILKSDRAGAGAEAGFCPSLIQEDQRRAVAKAMNLLLYKPRTEKELRDKLNTYDYEPQAIEFALQYVSFYGYLNDERYAESYVMSNGCRKSRAVIRSELTRKGVGEGAIEAAMELLETDERSLAGEMLLKRYGEPHEFDEKELRRAAGFLSRKGFSSSLVWSVLRDYQKSALPN